MIFSCSYLSSHKMSGHSSEVRMRRTTHQRNKTGEIFLQQMFQNTSNTLLLLTLYSLPIAVWQTTSSLVANENTGCSVDNNLGSCWHDDMITSDMLHHTTNPSFLNVSNDNQWTNQTTESTNVHIHTQTYTYNTQLFINNFHSKRLDYTTT